MQLATSDRMADVSFPQSTEADFVGGTTLGRIVQAEVDTQISTAKRYPRNLTMFKRNALSMATIDEDTAATCFYVLPRAGKKIEGPSIRLAEICASAWGNMRSGARIIDDDGKVVTAQGFAWDIQTNSAYSVEVRRRVTDKNGKRFTDDMVIVTCNAAASIALRNAIFKVIPMAYVREIWQEARKVAVGDAKTLDAKRTGMLAYFSKMGVDEKKILGVLEAKSVDDIDLDGLVTLKGLATAIKDGDTTIEEAFAGPAKSSLQEKIEAATKSGNGHKAKAASAPAPEPEDVHIEPDHGEATEDFPPRDEPAPAASPLDDGLRKGNALAEIKSQLKEAFGDDSTAISKTIATVFKVKSLATVERWAVAQVEGGLADLKAHLDTLPNEE